MTDQKQRQAASEFATEWKDRGKERADSQSFWLSLLRDVYGVEHPETIIEFENTVMLDHTSYIDGYIPNTRVLIEQKSRGKDLDAPIKQSDGSLLTPFQQAKRYVTELPLSKHPRWIVTSNFEEFRIYDMERPNDPAEVVALADLEQDYHRLRFLVDRRSEHVRREMELSITAGEIVGHIYGALRAQYRDPSSAESQHSLNVLCVRLVFCLYAESAGIFGRHGMFGDYLHAHTSDVRRALLDLFQVLDQPESERDPYLNDDLAEFPYVNGGLFRTAIEIPRIPADIVNLILHEASDDFDWRDISPTIFGAMFESTLNPETQHTHGMHYTSVENIHKVIDPLFLDDLRAELEHAASFKTVDSRRKHLNDFRDRLAGLQFLDPACGSGNFLTETYLSLRRLENEAIRALTHGQVVMDFADPIRVSIEQFYGVEINDFAVTVAQTALWIAEAQMLRETEDILSMSIDYLPLTTAAHIVQGNALQMDWNDVLPSNACSYVIGNPPFRGFTYMTGSQKQDMERIFPGVRNLDYVCAWYKTALDYIPKGASVAFVSTNSIVQGEIIGRFWPFMAGAVINFAHTSFVWDSEASAKAHVHVVVIGFSKTSRKPPILYRGNTGVHVSNISPYLTDGPDIVVTSRNKPLCNVPKMIYGNKPADGGNLIIEDEDYDIFLEKEPGATQFIRPLIGSAEYIKGKKRWCLWLENADPAELRKLPAVMKRIEGCRQMRLNSIAAGIRKFADTPSLFAQRTQPIGKDFIIIPRVSSERRRYIPIGFVKAGPIVNDRVQIVPDATLYEFGILTSNMHMGWVRLTAMRLKSDYSYSKDIVYNNFPWPNPTAAQKARIEQTAQAILDARDLYPNASLADLYDETTMPPELRRAHQDNDRAVMAAYGLPIKGTTEADAVAHLMQLYAVLTVTAEGNG